MPPGTDMAETESVRLNKYIASSGFCSRREADSYIENGKVTVNGVKADLGTRVFPGDSVAVEGREVVPKDDKIYLALHKPLGITCTTDTRDPDNIIDYIGYKERIFPIGRLDKNSSGLILLTNDGDSVNKLLRAEFGHEKEYEVRTDRKIGADFKEKMEKGIPLDGKITLPCTVTVTGNHTFRIILKQGLNRQIRRMCEYLGYRVVKLRRIRFRNIKLDGIKYGEYRLLTKREIDDLLNP
ncbi:MAG TPA: 23S rRNA pseudouridine synthase F [Clostridiales bacterium]|nr:23S rRNA pseudouridine synthase F [Clostridiales bacterium]